VDMTNWISVKDRLPEFSTGSGVLVFVDGRIHAAYFMDDKWIVGGWESCHYCGGESRICSKTLSGVIPN
jgi:hypothetical protein